MMPIACMTALLIASVVQPPPTRSPATPPPTPAATQPSPPLLSGPAASEDGAGKLSLVHRTFDGQIESIGPEPDAVAIAMLELTPEQRAKYLEIDSARKSAFDKIVRNNYALLVELASMQGEDNAAHRTDALRRVAAAFNSYNGRGTFYQEMWITLTDAQRKEVERMLAEYREARYADVHRRMGDDVPLRSIASRIRIEAFGEMVRASVERQIGFERDSFEQFAAELNLTPEQHNAAQAIFQPLAIKRYQNIEVTQAEKAEAFAAFNKLLDRGQKQKLLTVLVRQYQQQPGGAATTLPASKAPSDGAATKPATPMSYKLESGPHTVDEALLTFTDAQRKREVPVKLFLPKDLREPAPVIVLSPGWGGSRDGYGYLARHWASHGYFCMVLEHDGSDLDFAMDAADGPKVGATLRVVSALRESVNDPTNWINRAEDVTFALDELNRRNGQIGDELFNRLDLARVGMSGHSFGAYTTMLIMGALVDLPGEPQRGFRDSRCIAGIAMSSQGDTHLGLTANSWSNMAAPMLYLTGTKDFEIGSRDASGRRVGFDRTPADAADEQLLVTINDAEHFAFSDNNRGLGGEGVQRNPLHHQWILMQTLAFWDAHLHNDAAAKAWLDSDALKTISQDACAIERK